MRLIYTKIIVLASAGVLITFGCVFFVFLLYSHIEMSSSLKLFLALAFAGIENSLFSWILIDYFNRTSPYLQKNCKGGKLKNGNRL